VRRISLVSIALILVVGFVAGAWADPLADEMASMNARWDAAINNADFDALLPMYTADARLMPPGVHQVTGASRSVISLLREEEASEITNSN
jgi:hypothetical protein